MAYSHTFHWDLPTRVIAYNCPHRAEVAPQLRMLNFAITKWHFVVDMF